jgi:putative oxidoreductase
MNKVLFSPDEKTKELGHLLLRVIFGLFLMYNGWGKLVHFSDYATNFLDPFGIGAAASLSLVVFAELVCGLFIVLGFFTRLTTIPVLTTFIVAVFIAHGKDPFDVKQAALLHLFLSVYFIIAGSGYHSLDNRAIYPYLNRKLKGQPISAA